MIAVRLTLLGILLLLALTLGARTGAGQAGIKGKPKAGAPLVADPADLPKPGAVLGSMALVQRPGPLKGVRTWTIETKRHRWALLCSTASPDGKWVATGGYDGLIRIWDAETGALVRALAGHEAGVYALAWSPDGHYLASAGSYSTKVWDPTTGLAVRTLKGSKLGAGLVAWFPNGTRLVTAGAGSGQVAVFDVASSRELVAIEFGNAIVSIAVHPAGDRIAVVLNASALVIDATRLKTIYSLPNAAEGNYCSAFSPDGKLVALGSVKATRLFDVETGDFARKIDGPGYALAWTPTGGLIVVGTGNQVVAHAPATFAPGKPLPGLASWVTLSADGATLFGTYAPSITRWDVGKAESVRTFAVIESATLTTGPSTSVVVLHEGATIPTLWDAAGKRIGPLDGYVAGAYSSWSPTGKIFAVAGYDSKIRTWDPATGKPLRTLTTPKAVTALAVAMDGKIAAALADGTIAVWPATGEAILHTLTGHPSPATALAWTADGRFLASGGEKDLMTWGMDKGKRLKTIDPIRPVYGLAWTTDASKLVVASSAEVALVVYAAGTGKPISTIEKGESNLATSTLSWSPDGTILLGYRGGGIQQWNVKSGRATQAIGSPAATSTHSFMPDGRMVSVGCVDRTVRYIEAATGRLRFSAVADADHLIAVNAEGHYRPADIAEAELIAIVHTDKGQETMPLKDFAARYGFRNQPTLVK